MKAYCSVIAVIFMVSASCEKKADRITIEEIRGSTSKDIPPKLFATSDERFRNAQPSPIKGTPPENWLALPAKQFRELNYRFGDSGEGEVYVTIAGGSVADNVNRWQRQFGIVPSSESEIKAMAKVPIAGYEGAWLEAEGTYAAGMGTPAKSGQALAGIIAEVGGKILTLKMVGPVNEVKAEKDALKAFAASLDLVK